MDHKTKASHFAASHRDNSPTSPGTASQGGRAVQPKEAKHSMPINRDNGNKHCGNQYNEEQIAKSRKSNVLQSKVGQTASEADSAQGDVFRGSNQISQCQSTTTRARNVGGNAATNPRKQIVACQLTKTMATNITGN
jgi:hypothetical protein